jgi:hypothetical protein
MGKSHEGMAETMQLIKEAVYDLAIGPSEISPSTEHPATYSVKFDNYMGEAAEIFVPMASKYASIHDALMFAYRGKKNR